MKTIIIDPGHGGSDPGAAYKGNEEKTFNLLTALKVREYLIDKYEVRILMTRSENKTMPLTERSNFANSTNADFYLSIHHNAGGGTGFESYTFNGSVPAATLTYQTVIHNGFINEIKKKYPVIDRGKKRADFHVLRETKMPSLLVEILFIDNDKDVSLLNNTGFRNDTAMLIAEGVAKALSLPEKKESPGGQLYKVIAGSFTDRKNAEDRAALLKQKSYDAFITTVVISGKTYYRVQAGAFTDKANAEKLAAELNRKKIEAFILTEGTGNGPSPSPSPAPPEKDVTILGESLLKPHQLNEFVKIINPGAPLLGDYYIKYGKDYGIRGDIAFGQAIHETNYFRFTGQVKPEQNNFAGLGTTGPGVDGASFKSPEEGVLAHIQHLYAYASKEKLPPSHPLVDPRFSLVSRGSADYWTKLNGKWAVPGTTYGQSILSVYSRNLDHALAEMEIQKKNIQERLDLLK
ncbi:N-acetylmuramoyl-L-alanine amidase [Rossellomorea aquimaris]|uniref:Sporulation protein n=1 Tax=Rossellomorea aquimaris TaxID=189382 RepID=A0A1J6X523_9BACI|nr:N-acetylmuramoyl-L-alanine amidase [Rossellomorea aquimaris]OIU73233.1 sporulation protein [Rossellomorea aquimaris]